MTVEAYILNDGGKQVYTVFNRPGQGHLYASYPNGSGSFEALVVHCIGEAEADVYEVEDGSSLELGFDLKALPEDATVTHVDVANPYERDIFSPDGNPGKLIVTATLGQQTPKEI